MRDQRQTPGADAGRNRSLTGTVGITMAALCAVCAGLVAGGPGGFVPTPTSTLAVIAPAGAQQPAPSIWGGIYTEEQADRGESTVARQCGFCHGDDLSGSDDPGPPLRGAFFLDPWYGRSVAELLVLIAETMPYDDPGSLALTDYADAIAYILRTNGFPSGTSELPASPDDLVDTRFARKPQA
jgi:mono/diheme cytochrome c family protein